MGVLVERGFFSFPIRSAPPHSAGPCTNQRCVFPGEHILPLSQDSDNKQQGVKMKKYRDTETFFDGGHWVVDEFRNKTFVSDGLAEARQRLNFFQQFDDGTDETIKEQVLVLKEAIADMEANR
jgi:hypothetical protein